MSELNIQLCPETGICSLVKEDGSKIDLMPDEVSQVRDAAGDPDAVRKALGEIDSGFTEGLAPGQLSQISAILK